MLSFVQEVDGKFAVAPPKVRKVYVNSAVAPSLVSGVDGNVSVAPPVVPEVDGNGEIATNLVQLQITLFLILNLCFFCFQASQEQKRLEGV